ncbi:hypothetical protein [Actinoplanes sp. NPDC049681]|uniref:hypothetical protein n=1 Tax=Actinoplanes sp. NPDC049681 TaxID=3363905 RepID=UPI0037920F7F
MGDPIAVTIGAFCVVFLALVVVAAVFGSRRRRREQDRMRQWAARKGWTFTAHPHVDWGRQLPGGNRNGIDYAFSTVLRGRPVTVAQYSVTEASDGTTTNTHYPIVTVAVLKRSFPSVEVTARARASRLKSALFGGGETATGNPDFDRNFRVRTTAPAAMRHWLSPSLIAAQLGGQVPSTWNMQGTELFYHRPGRLELDEIADHAIALTPLADLLDGGT